MTKKPSYPKPITDQHHLPKQPLYTHRVITCSKCNEPGGTLIKVEADTYIHKAGSGCNI